MGHAADLACPVQKAKEPKAEEEDREEEEGQDGEEGEDEDDKPLQAMVSCCD